MNFKIKRAKIITVHAEQTHAAFHLLELVGLTDHNIIIILHKLLFSKKKKKKFKLLHLSLLSDFDTPIGILTIKVWIALISKVGVGFN